MLAGGKTGNGTARDNEVVLAGGTVSGTVAGALIENGGTAVGNTVKLTGTADVAEAQLYGWQPSGGNVMPTEVEAHDNALVIDDWTGATQSMEQFDTVRFEGVEWEPDATILKITEGAEGALANTRIDAGHVVLLGDRTPQVGESMTFIQNSSGLTGQATGGYRASSPRAPPRGKGPTRR